MNKTKKLAIGFIISSVLFFVLSFYSINQVNSLVIDNIDKIHNSYVSSYDISNVDLQSLSLKLDEIERQITSNEVTFVVNNNEYKYSISELGVRINKSELSEEINEYESGLDYWTLYHNYSKNSFEEKYYEYKYVIDEEVLNNFVSNLKKRFNVLPKAGNLAMSKDRVLEYKGEVVGFKLDEEKIIETIKNNFSTLNYNEKIIIDGESITLENPLKVIDTKISSFTTIFDDTISRKYNLMAGAKHLDGLIIQPHTEFSFFENVGPYDGTNDFVYYLGVMGNGVCQVATTLYNAELLGGLTTVERYNHGVKSVYVDGGLDATVAVTRGYVTDFKFRNDYDYPVYISAFVDGDKLTIELWSNNSVKEGKEYKTESVRLGFGAYKALRHTYKDGNLINTEDLGISYYSAE